MRQIITILISHGLSTNKLWKVICRKCLIWSPLSCVTWFIPCIGHVAIADSEGNTYDFHGTNLIGKNNLLFGYPTKILQICEPGVDDEEWDKTLKESILKYQHQTYNILYGIM